VTAINLEMITRW